MITVQVINKSINLGRVFNLDYFDVMDIHNEVGKRMDALGYGGPDYHVFEVIVTENGETLMHYHI